MEDKDKSFAYKATMENGLDTTSLTTLVRETNSPFMMNLISKEGSGLKRRDGLEEINGIDFVLSGEIICGSYHTDNGMMYLIVKDGSSDYYLKVIIGSKVPLISKIVLPKSIFNDSIYIRFKVILNFPKTSKNIFIYGYYGKEYDYQSNNYFNIAGTIDNNLTLGTFSINTVVKSNVVSGSLNIIDADVISNRLVCLVNDTSNNNFQLLFGAKDSIDLNGYYTLPGSAHGTGLIINRDNVFIMTPVSVYLITYKDSFTGNTFFSKYINSYGCKHPWAYSVVNTDCYMVSSPSFFKFSLIVEKKNQTTIDVNESIDDLVSNFYPMYSTYITLYRWDEKTIYFYGSFINDFTEYSIYLWKIMLKGYTKTYEEFRLDIKNKTQFALCYNIIKKSWFLLYWDFEIKGAVPYIKRFLFNNNEIKSEFTYVTKDKVLFNNKTISQDIKKDFIIEFMPGIINNQELTGYQILIERIMVLVSNVQKIKSIDGYNAIVSSVILNENITRITRESIFNTFKSPLNLHSNISLKVASNLVDSSPNYLICFNSKYIDVLKGVVINVRKSGNITS